MSSVKSTDDSTSWRSWRDAETTFSDLRRGSFRLETRSEGGLRFQSLTPGFHDPTKREPRPCISRRRAVAGSVLVVGLAHAWRGIWRHRGDRGASSSGARADPRHRCRRPEDPSARQRSPALRTIANYAGPMEHLRGANAKPSVAR